MRNNFMQPSIPMESISHTPSHKIMFTSFNSSLLKFWAGGEQSSMIGMGSAEIYECICTMFLYCTLKGDHVENKFCVFLSKKNAGCIH